MSTIEPVQEEGRFYVENIGGIDETAVTVTPGVTVLTGRNATNRTSLLQAMMAALGSDRASLRGGADKGYVELTIGNETYTRTLRRRNGTVTTAGDPYLNDPELANLFAFLLESNDARRSVAFGGDLRELIMRPVDTDAIKSEIHQLEDEKRRLDEQLDDLESLENRLPELDQERTRIKNAIAQKCGELKRGDASNGMESASMPLSRTSSPIRRFAPI